MRSKRVVGMGACVVTLLVLGLGGLVVYERSVRLKVVWGQEKLWTSERDFLLARFADLDAQWRGDSLDPFRDPATSFVNTTTTERVLVVDLPGSQFWLEEGGAYVPGSREMLPRSMRWSVYHAADNELETLSGIVALRDGDRRRNFDEMVVLVGQGESEHVSWWLWGRSAQSSLLSEGVFDPNSILRPGYSSRRSVAQDSPLLQDALDLQRLQEQARKFDSQTIERLPWVELQRQLFPMIEQKVVDEGKRLQQLVSVFNYGQKHGMVGAKIEPDSRTGFMNQILQKLGLRRARFRQNSMVLTVCDMGGGCWRCMSSSKRLMGSQMIRMTDFEIRLNPLNVVPEDVLTFDAVMPPEKASIGESPWTLELSSGVRLEIVGLCLKSGAVWWGPDGSELDYWPGFLNFDGDLYRQIQVKLMRSGISKSMGSTYYMRDARISNRAGEVNLLIKIPTKTTYSGSTSSQSGSSGLFYGRTVISDKEGRAVLDGQTLFLSFKPHEQSSHTSRIVGIHTLKGSQERPTLVFDRDARRMRTMAVRGRGGEPVPSPDQALDFEWVEIKNVALRPGQKTDFQMRIVEDVADPNLHIRFKVQP